MQGEMHFQQVKGGEIRGASNLNHSDPKKDQGSCISSTFGCLLQPLNVTLDGFPISQQCAGRVGLLGLDSRDAQLLQPSTCLFAVVYKQNASSNPKNPAQAKQKVPLFALGTGFERKSC